LIAVEILEKIALLQEFFGEHIVEHGVWPPQSPDLTPPDFFLWEFFKEKSLFK
jgi:hypothetical protein